jgi:probable rRNA maturation factor
MPSDGSTVVLFRALPANLKLSISDKRSLQNFAHTLSAQVADGRPFICLLANDHQLLCLNREFLRRDYPADVLSFPASDPSSLGELAISIDRANAQAIEHRHTLLAEIRILMLHGVLHLTGLDHERDHGEMARAEGKWRSVFDLPVTLIARAGPRPSSSAQGTPRTRRRRQVGVH